MGTRLQEIELTEADWHGHDGCNEYLNLSRPDLIESVHASFYAAGSDAVETNTFGASPVTLEEYGLGARAEEINIAAAQAAGRAARAAEAKDGRPRYVMGSIGPGTRLVSLGQISFDELVSGYQVQIKALLKGGVDGILFETCQDPLQIKAGLVAFDDVAGLGGDTVLYVSVTVEQTGTLLVGSSIQAITSILSPYPIDVLGLNCATGPKAMRLHLDYLRDHWSGALACMPNAGLPKLTPEGTLYPLGPVEFAKALGELARNTRLQVLGGCCGTTTGHIQALCKELADYKVPDTPFPTRTQQVASLFDAVDLEQDPRPLFIGERANATGSRKFRDLLLEGNYEACFTILTDQEESGAHVLDLSCAYAGHDEQADIEELVPRAARECRAPLVIDSTQIEVVEAALKRYGGRMIINSINFESGEERADQVVRLARRFGAAVIALTIDETGMAMNAQRKLEIAGRLITFCEERGLSRGDLLIDPLTFTIGSGDETLRTAALETLEGIQLIKKEWPGSRTVLGLSNISFGLKARGRKVINTVFLDQVLKAGMDACIINVAAIVPLNQLPEEERTHAEALLMNDHSKGDPLEDFLNFFAGITDQAEEVLSDDAPPEERLGQAIIKGRPAALASTIPTLLEDRSAEDILNGLLVPAMKEVGRLFNDGILQLPFVLKSAEVMKKAVDMIKPFMKKDEEGGGGATMVIATVSGDVHDIGKNLVDIILSNNGFTVANMGTKVPVEAMVEAVKEHKADVLGMSGLLVKSATIMAENMTALKTAGIDIPIFLGGAALTPGFVAEACQPLYEGPVVYCKDAFDGLAFMRTWHETGHLDKAELPDQPATPEFEAPPIEIDLSQPAPKMPFQGARQVVGIDLDEVYPLLNTTALIRGRWGYRRGKMDEQAYKELLETDVMPRLESFKQMGRDGLFEARIAYGWYPCRGQDTTLLVDGPEGTVEMEFPRQPRSPHLSIPDFFRRDQDVAGFFIVTLGSEFEKRSKDLMEGDAYQEYFLLHGFAVEVTDALAELCHARMRAELGYPDPPLTIQDYIVQNYQGSRYGFGYPACPELQHNAICSQLVNGPAIDVELSDNYMMVPEVSTSALVVHHEKAKYFNV